MVQFAEVDKYKGNSTYPGAVDGPARWHGMTGAIASIYLSAGAAYELADELSVGVASVDSLE